MSISLSPVYGGLTGKWNDRKEIILNTVEHDRNDKEFKDTVFTEFLPKETTYSN